MAALEAANPAVTAYIQRGAVPNAPEKTELKKNANIKAKPASSKPPAAERAAMLNVRLYTLYD